MMRIELLSSTTERTAAALRRALIALCLVSVVLGPNAHADELDSVSVGLFRAQLKLAEAGDTAAQFYVGEMYEKGLGTAQSFDQAFIWYNKSSQLGYSRAREKIDNWDRILQDAERDRERAAAAARALEEAARARERAATEAAAARARQQAEAEARARRQAEAEARERASTEARERPAADAAPHLGSTAKPVDVAPTDKKDDPQEFTANPCKGPSAKFLSTCK